MAIEVKISCVTPDGADHDYRLDGVGGYHDGKQWKLTIDAAIQGIQNGQWKFYTGDTVSTRANVVVRRSSAGRLYLTTEPDNLTSNNLSNLPKCRN